MNSYLAQASAPYFQLLNPIASKSTTTTTEAPEEEEEEVPVRKKKKKVIKINLNFKSNEDKSKKE